MYTAWVVHICARDIIVGRYLVMEYNWVMTTDVYIPFQHNLFADFCFKFIWLDRAEGCVKCCYKLAVY